MERAAREGAIMKSPAFRGLARAGAIIASGAAALVGVALAVVFAASLVAIVLIGLLLVPLTAVALRARRSASVQDGPVLEARRIGGHAWVAYGWDKDA